MKKVGEINAIVSRNVSFLTPLYETPEGNLVIYYMSGYYRCDRTGNIGDRYITKNKIKFVDRNNKETFQISDGEEIIVKYASGEVNTRKCFYVDDHNTIIGTILYHNQKFAKQMENAGNTFQKSI